MSAFMSSFIWGTQFKDFNICFSGAGSSGSVDVASTASAVADATASAVASAFSAAAANNSLAQAAAMGQAFDSVIKTATTSAFASAKLQGGSLCHQKLPCSQHGPTGSISFNTYNLIHLHRVVIDKALWLQKRY